MRVFISLFLATLLGTALATDENTKLHTATRSMEELRSALSAAGGCNVNVCFALDGSGSVSEFDFERQKGFVMDVINVIAGNPIEAAACQYGITASPISFLTDKIDDFILDVNDADFLNAAGTSISAGIVWCSGQLQDNPTEPAKIVVLGDGRNTIGRGVTRRANRFRAKGGKVCAVGIGFNAGGLRRLTRIAGGDPSLVLRVRNYLELADILEDCVEAVCGVSFL